MDIVEIFYSPEPHTTIKINEVEQPEFRQISKLPIEEWVYKIESSRIEWNGIIKQLSDFVGDEDFVIKFYGREEDLEVLKSAIKSVKSEVQIINGNNSINQDEISISKVKVHNKEIEDLFLLGEKFKNDDNSKAFEYYDHAAREGHIKAQYELGMCYKEGRGTKKDISKAIEWYRKAAEQGYDRAQNNLGMCYEYGDGVEKDISKAVEWYKKAAEQGYDVAQTNLGICYEYGQGVKQSFEQAVVWYKKAGNNGNLRAQRLLAAKYYKGWGIAKDKNKAIELLKMAAANGDEKSKKLMKEYNQKGKIGFFTLWD